MAQRKPILPPTYLCAALVLMGMLHFIVPGPRLLEVPWTLIGLGPLALGAAMNVLADHAFKRWGTTVKPFEESSYLVMDGVFAISRNPMYLGFLLILLGVGALLGTLTPLAVPVLFRPVLQLRFIRTEERMLAARFGNEWEAYRARVRRWDLGPRATSLAGGRGPPGGVTGVADVAKLAVTLS